MLKYLVREAQALGGRSSSLTMIVVLKRNAAFSGRTLAALDWLKGHNHRKAIDPHFVITDLIFML